MASVDHKLSGVFLIESSDDSDDGYDQGFSAGANTVLQQLKNKIKMDRDVSGDHYLLQSLERWIDGMEKIHVRG